MTQNTPASWEEKKCKHQFWKDRNPAGCMNCGKTESELFQELIAEAEERGKQSQQEYIDAGNAIQNRLLEICIPHMDKEIGSTINPYMCLEFLDKLLNTKKQ